MNHNNSSYRLSLNSIDKIIIDKNIKNNKITLLTINKIENNKIFVNKNDHKNKIELESELNDDFNQNLEEEFVDILSDGEEEELAEEKNFIYSFKELNQNNSIKKINNGSTQETLISKKELELKNENNNPIELKFYIKECIICLNKLKIKDQLMKINECEHYFHLECVTEWVIDKGTKFCPLCK